MTIIRDTDFLDKIIPAFDFVCNDFSRKSLYDFFHDMPMEQEEVLQRQQILKSLLATKQLFISFSYSRSEFNEAYEYLETLRNRNEETAFIVRLYYLYKQAPARKEQGRLTQLYNFLYKISRVYFSDLDPDCFPPAFAANIYLIKRFFNDIELDKNQSLIRKKGLRISRMIRLADRLAEKSRNGEVGKFWKSLVIFETYLSLSKGIKKHKFNFPEFTGQGIQLEGFYHPLLKQPVRNSLDTESAVILLTGPNMSGKSTLLKSVALCVYLGRLGLAVPAQKAAFAFFDSFSIAINLNDDLQQGYSHFMTEIQTLKAVLLEARQGKKCFAIFDELFRGTNAEDALAISQQTINGLTQFKGSQFFISTHLQTLKENIHPDNPAITLQCIECNLDQGIPHFTYRLLPGWSDLKIGQVIFEQEGLNELLTNK